MMKKNVVHHIHDKGNYELGLRYSVYLPSSYGHRKKQYNILYLLHGAGDDEYGWICKGYAQQILNELDWDSSIVVMPLCFLNKCEMVKWSPPSRSDFESFWFSELVPSIIDNYRVYTDGSHQAIAGLSLGAEQALDLSWCGKSFYAGIGCFSPVFSRQPVVFDNSFSEMIKERWPSQSNNKQSDVLRLFYLACADKDHLSAETSRSLAEFMSDKLSAAGTSFISDLYTPGFHEWNFWRYGLKCFLQNLDKFWTHNN